jgi:hypothetical protein
MLDDTSRRMTTTRAKQVVIGATCLGVLVAAFLAWRGQVSVHASPVAGPVETTITIDASVGEVFAPPPTPAQPALTAGEAWLHYAKLNGSLVSSMPSMIDAQLGLLSLPPTAENELAYGYSWDSCPVSTVDGSALVGTPCIEWLFLDADSGRQIDDTWQQ